MAHPLHDRRRLLNRARRIRGQIQAIERALEGDAGCEEVMHLVSASRGAISSLLSVVVEEHIRTHLIDRDLHPGALDSDAVEQLVQVVHSYFK